MIDVVFLLIIFFMVGTQFTDTEQQIDIKLPGANNLSAMIATPERREVLINSAGTAFLDGQPVTISQLTEQLRQLRLRYPDLAIAVRADGDAMQKYVVPVYGAIQSAGVTNTAVLGVQTSKIR